jgi:heme/copper-type cytochrome/quinol oxidase subunit 2
MGKVLLIVVLVLLVLAVAQIMRVYELSSKVRGSSEATITKRENSMNAFLMLVFCGAFFAFVIWQMIAFGGGIKGPAVSLHGEKTDWLLGLNFGIIIPVFFICNGLLFYFAYKYAYDKDRKATFFTHSNKLEFVWTVVPAIVLAVVIILGLQSWNQITDTTGNFVVQSHSNLHLNPDDAKDANIYTSFTADAAFETSDGAGSHLSELGETAVLVEKPDAWVLQTYAMVGEDSLVINEVTRFKNRNDALVAMMTEGTTEFTELKEPTNVSIYAKQFDWTTRYAGKDNKLGEANFKLIDYNSWGVTVEGDTTGFINPLGLISSETVRNHLARINAKVDTLSVWLTAESAQFETDVVLAEWSSEMERLKRKRMRIQSSIANQMNLFGSVETEVNDKVYDDVVAKGDLHLVVGRPYQFHFKAQDVIHSAYFPHFRAQMNCVPGATTLFKFTPIMTTKEFKKHPVIIKKYKGINKKRAAEDKAVAEPAFLLLCNKICGASHHHMWINIIVETQEEYDAWIATQKTFENQLVEAGLKK